MVRRSRTAPTGPGGGLALGLRLSAPPHGAGEGVGTQWAPAAFQHCGGATNVPPHGAGERVGTSGAATTIPCATASYNNLLYCSDNTSRGSFKAGKQSTCRCHLALLGPSGGMSEAILIHLPLYSAILGPILKHRRHP